MTRLLLSLRESRAGESGIAFECDGCGRRAPARDSDRPDRWVPADWIETFPRGHRDWAGAGDATQHWCRRCLVLGLWEGEPRDLAALPERREL